LTTDGRFVRIDQLLEAIIRLSLLHIYNGSSNAPISLLK
jgi:hypothetical protein